MPDQFKCVRNEKNMPRKQCEKCIYRNASGIPLEPLVKVSQGEVTCLTGRAWLESENWQHMALHKLDQKGLDPFGNPI